MCSHLKKLAISNKIEVMILSLNFTKLITRSSILTSGLFEQIWPIFLIVRV